MSKRVANVKGSPPRHRHFRKHLVMSKYRVAPARTPVIDMGPYHSTSVKKSWLKSALKSVKNFIRRKT